MEYLKEIQNKGCVYCSQFLLKGNGQLAKDHYIINDERTFTLWSLLYQWPPTLWDEVFKFQTLTFSSVCNKRHICVSENLLCNFVNQPLFTNGKSFEWAVRSVLREKYIKTFWHSWRSLNHLLLLKASWLTAKQSHVPLTGHMSVGSHSDYTYT